MKKIVVLILFLLTINLAIASALYQQESLTMQLDVTGEFELVEDGPNPHVTSTTTDLYLYPYDSYRQELQDIDTQGVQKNGALRFETNENKIGTYSFGYSALVKTNNERKEVQRKISFPIPDDQIRDVREYLEPTKTIDSNDPAIIRKAQELVQNEDDLFKATFKLASWVEDNVDYDLNTLTEKSSQKASWVLENRQGVCDEMTSLFVAMARSQGIPARFVSGISYTTSELFEKPWQPHGWAEVYFPDVGWVAFDIAFGEYGYVDVTHIKLRDGFDPQEAATSYNWLSNDVKLETSPLDMQITIEKQGAFVPQEIKLDQQILSTQVDIGSYNVVKGILKNTANHYAATTLRLAVPDEVSIIGEEKHKILLEPREVRETFWIIKVDNTLDQNYFYTFPVIIYTEKNVSIQSQFTAQKGSTNYDKNDINHLTVQDEEKTYSRLVAFTCSYPELIKEGQQLEVTCTIQNNGAKELRDLEFCVANSCHTLTLAIEGKRSITTQFIASGVGRHNLLVSALNEDIEKRTAFSYVVTDDPGLDVHLTSKEIAYLDQPLVFAVELEKKSFISPQNVRVVLQGLGFENVWEIENFDQKEILTLEVQNPRLAKENHFEVLVTWQDEQGTFYSTTKEIEIEGRGRSFSDKVVMFFNGLLNVFY